MSKKDECLIPPGSYCYTLDKEGNQVNCSHWRHDTVHTEKYENGYCEYLKKGDWDLNREPSIEWEETRQKDGTYIRKVFNPPAIPAELGLKESLLWDQVKMCNINDDLEDEEE